MLADNPCFKCQALCCQHIKIPLNPEEADQLRRAGTVLIKEKQSSWPLGKVGACMGSIWQHLSGNRNNYHMERCGYLSKDNGWLHCSIHESQRPDICSRLRAGSQGCTFLQNWQVMRNME